MILRLQTTDSVRVFFLARMKMVGEVVLTKFSAPGLFNAKIRKIIYTPVNARSYYLNFWLDGICITRAN